MRAACFGLNMFIIMVYGATLSCLQLDVIYSCVCGCVCIYISSIVYNTNQILRICVSACSPIPFWQKFQNEKIGKRPMKRKSDV